MKYTEDTLYDRLVGQYGFDPGDLDDFFRVNSKRNWLTYINKGETDIDRLADVIEEWLGYIDPMDESTAKDIVKARNNMRLDEAKQVLKSVGYRVINEREINLNYLLKDIFELLTSFGISATDDEVEKLMWTYINSGRKPENATAEDILEFDIDNDPDTIIDYTGDFVDWIKRGQYKTGPVDESVQINEDADEPATKKQLWALFCIYKKDFRDQGLTKGAAAEMISKAQEEKPYVKTKGKSLDKQICEHIETYLKPKLDEKMEEAFGMQSVVGDADLEGNLIPGGKRYKFFGGGCGFAWLKYDKRNKKIGEIESKYEEIYRDKYFEKYAKEYIKKYGERDMGGVLSQDLNIQYTIQYAIVDFMKKIGMNVDNVSVYGRLD